MKSSSPRGAQPIDGGAHPELELVRRLCETLSAQGVDYCHWKSNEALDRSARAESDSTCSSAACTLSGSRDHPEPGLQDQETADQEAAAGVFHSYGLDQASGKVVHLHVHYRLVVGDDMTKNYRLPLEEAYLASARQGSLFRVPAPEFDSWSSCFGWS